MSKKTKKAKARKRNGQTKILSIIAVVLLLSMGLVMILPLQSIVQEPPLPSYAQTVAVSFYFRDQDGSWGNEERQIELRELRTDTIESILRGLVDGPEAATLLPSVPYGVYIEGAQLRVGTEENTLVVTFSASFGDVPPLERVFTMASFVWTLTELDFVDHLLFYVGEEPMLDGDGNPFGLRSRSNTTLEDSPPPWEADTVLAALYFANDDATGLVAEMRNLQIGPLQDIDRAKVDALIAGPFNPDLFSFLPADTTYNRVERSGDMVTVDFTESFLDGFGGGSLAEEMMIFSLVNTLTQGPEVRRVLILVDGLHVQDEDGMFHMDLSMPIERDESLIITEE